MATINYSVQEYPNVGRIVTWGPFTENDTCTAWEGFGCADKTITATGTFGTTPSVAFQGSNDGTNFFACNDPTGSAIALTAAGMKAVLENPRVVRPAVTGTGNSITVILVARNTQG